MLLATASTGRPVAVDGHGRVRAVVVLDPERGPEPLGEPRGVAAPPLRARPAERLQQLCTTERRLVARSPAPRRGDGTAGQVAVGEADRVGRVLPALVGQAAGRLRRCTRGSRRRRRRLSQPGERRLQRAAAAARRPRRAMPQRQASCSRQTHSGVASMRAVVERRERGPARGRGRRAAPRAGSCRAPPRRRVVGAALRAASTRSVPRAKSVPSGSSIRAAQRESRPNSVKNHGEPAARKTSAGDSGVAIRRPCRSARQRRSRVESRRSSTRSAGCDQVGAAGGGVTGAPTSSTSTRHVRTARPPGGMSTCHTTVPAAASRSPPGASTVTRVSSCAQTRRPGSPRAGPGRPMAPNLTRSTCSRSAPTSRQRCVVTGMVAQELTTMRSSSRPGVISRIRSTRTLGSGTGSPTLRAKPTKRARPAPSAAPRTESGTSFPTVRRSRDSAGCPRGTGPGRPGPPQGRRRPRNGRRAARWALRRPPRGRAAAAGAGRGPGPRGPAGVGRAGWCGGRGCRRRLMLQSSPEDLVTWQGNAPEARRPAPGVVQACTTRGGAAGWKAVAPSDHPRGRRVAGSAGVRAAGQRRTSGTATLPINPTARRT